MGLYNVVEPCAAADVQYVRPTAEFQPVEIDDEVAGPLVAEGKLSHYAPGAEAPATRPPAKRPRRGDDEG